jgi:sterol desaturase/sphingolipid hydroxylase (fatty acid hydroxylase superfamily)
MKTILFFIIITAFMVEFFGYLWHRFSAHLGYAGNTIRKTHYEHHEIYYPHGNMETDEYRIKGFFNGDSWPWLVPLFGMILFLTVLWKYSYLPTKGYITMCVWIVLHVYFISYIHDSYHIRDHWLNRFQWYQRNKLYHNLHHFYNCNYGISNYSMDYLFGTMVTEYTKNKENIFKGFVYPINNETLIM